MQCALIALLLYLSLEYWIPSLWDMKPIQRPAFQANNGLLHATTTVVSMHYIHLYAFGEQHSKEIHQIQH